MTNEVAYNPFHGPRLAIAVIVLCVLAVFARGDDASDRDRKARAALALSGSAKPALVATAPAPRGIKPKDYPTGYAMATASQQPLVVFVGCDVQPVEGAVSCKCDAPSFADVKAPAVVVSYPVGNKLMIDAALKGEPKPEAVQKAVKDAAKKIDVPPLKGTLAPKPLDWSISAEAPAPAAVYNLDLPAGAQKYDGAKYTQSISVLMTASGDRDVIQPVPVLSVPDTRWRQAGGMEGISGYTSERYKYIPTGQQVKHWVGNVEVENSITNPLTGTKYKQHNRAILRSYPDGTRFDEVLTNSQTGVVFEHRVRTKKDGKWLSEVWHKDEANFPAGYTGLKVACNSCHGEAGTGKYDSGLVPGGDTVLSDPLPWEVAGLKSPEETEQIGLFRRFREPKKQATGSACEGGNCPLPGKSIAPKAKGACGLCGDACKCKPGECPQKCPVAPKAAPPAVVQYRYEFMGTDRRGVSHYRLVPAGDGCPNGNCPLQKK